MDEVRISAAGDGFYAAALKRQDDLLLETSPHGCYGGYVYIGFEEDGAEHTYVVRCRRCEDDEHERWLAEADRINEAEMWRGKGRPSL